ncbi:MAG: redoxin domain-containing protein [Planctomycetota bacterium]
MRKTNIVLSAALATGLLAAPVFAQAKKVEAQGKQVQADKTFEHGKPVDGSITLPGLDGKDHKLADYKGKVIVLDFWSFNCPISKRYEDKFKQLVKKYQGKEVVFLAIDSNKSEIDADAEDPYHQIRKYVEKEGVTMNVLVDKGNVIADRFGAKTTPHVFILDPKLVLSYQGSVDNDQRGQLGKEAMDFVSLAVDALLAGREVEHKKTTPFGCSIKRVTKIDG